MGSTVLPKLAFITHQKYVEGLDKVESNGLSEAGNLWGRLYLNRANIEQTDEMDEGIRVKIRRKDLLGRWQC